MLSDIAIWLLRRVTPQQIEGLTAEAQNWTDAQWTRFENFYQRIRDAHPNLSDDQAQVGAALLVKHQQPVEGKP